MTAYWQQIPARPTTYRGVAMRSRLEARFAAMIDDEGWDWSYEPRAYGSPAGQYLPDFEVQASHGGKALIEVKPTVDTALASLARMQIIWESDPDAFLMMVFEDGEDWHLFAARGDERRWRFMG